MPSRGTKRNYGRMANVRRRQYSPDPPGRRRRSPEVSRRSDRRSPDITPRRSGATRNSELKTIIVSNFPVDVGRTKVKEALFKEFGEFGDCKITTQYHPRTEELLAYCTFRSATAAREAKTEGQTFNMKGKKLHIEFDFTEERRERFRSRSRSNSYEPSNQRHFKTNNYSRGRKSYGDDHRKFPEGYGRTFPNEIEEMIPPPEISFQNPNFTPATEDFLASRTLYLSGLESSITEQMVIRLFKPFGSLESIYLKNEDAHLHANGGYCFIKYKNVDMAYMAKLCLNNKMLGNVPMQIKYGKIRFSPRVWVGGIEPHVSLDDLEAEFDRFGIIKSIDFNSGSDCAAIKFETEGAAQEAVKQMKGFLMAGTKTRLKTDFLDMEPHINIFKFDSSYRSGVHDFLANPPATLELMRVVQAAEMEFKNNQAKSAIDLKQLCRSFFAPFWRGGFRLKGVDFPVNFFHLKGEKNIFNQCIADSNYPTGRKPFIELKKMMKMSETNMSKMMQRLELPDIQKNSCLLLAVPGMPNDLPNISDPNCNHKPFRGCVKFFTYKGLLTACTSFPKVSKRNSESKDSELAGSMIAFPPCQFVTQQLLKIGPALQPVQFLPEYMLVYFVAGPKNLY